MYPFCIPWKHQKTLRIQGVEKGCIGNEWVKGVLKYVFSLFYLEIAVMCDLVQIWTTVSILIMLNRKYVNPECLQFPSYQKSIVILLALVLWCPSVL